MNKQQQTLELISDYRKSVDWSVDLLKKHALKFGNSRIERIGHLDENTHFEFHGVGCLVKYKGIVIDFDFRENGRYDGIDLYFIKSYWESKQSDYPHLNSFDVMRENFEKLVSDGSLIKPNPDTNQYLYYSKEDWENDSPKVW